MGAFFPYHGRNPSLRQDGSRRAGRDACAASPGASLPLVDAGIGHTHKAKNLIGDGFEEGRPFVRADGIVRAGGFTGMALEQTEDYLAQIRALLAENAGDMETPTGAEVTV